MSRDAIGAGDDWWHSLGLLAEALDDLLVTEDLTDEDLREASEGLLPALADCLKGRHAYRASIPAPRVTPAPGP